MPKIQSETPKTIRPFIAQGIQFHEDNGINVVGQCPFCDKLKFSVEIATSKFRCFVCEATGNAVTFIEQLYDRLRINTQYEYKGLREERKLIFDDTLDLWGVVKRRGDWILPGYSSHHKVHQLYRYIKDSKTGKKLLLATAGLPHGIHGLNLYYPDKPTVYLCEGPWDGMALWELLRVAHREKVGSLSYTGNEESSLLASANVLAIPGIQSFATTWLPFFKDKVVVLMFDSDHPREIANKTIKDGYDAMKRVAGLLATAEEPPKEIRYLNWGKEGYDPKEKSGYDVRDLLSSQGNETEARLKCLTKLLQKVTPIPNDWVAGRAKKATPGGTESECRPCTDWKTLINYWRKSGMVWTEGLDRAFSIMLAATLSTGSDGSQLWVKVMSPPSTGKTTLCEALSINRKHVKALSTIRGFHSGYREGDGSDNKSLILKIKGKTLVTKDGDTLLTAPNRDQVLSEARDLYDKTARSDYRTGMGMDHTDVHMTWILCGTNSLRQLDSSDLGARFLDCVIMDSIDDDLEDDIVWRAANKMKRSVSIRYGSDNPSSVGGELTEAMCRTGGYIDYLLDNAEELLLDVEMDDETTREVCAMAKYVAYMRARPSTKQSEGDDRELSARLVEQLVRLAMCLAVVLTRKTVDEEVLRRVRQTAVDTGRGLTQRIADHIYSRGEVGASVPMIAEAAHQTEDQVRKLLRFLKRIEVVENYKYAPPTAEGKPSMSLRVHYRLTAKMEAIYRRVTNGGKG